MLAVKSLNVNLLDSADGLRHDIVSNVDIHLARGELLGVTGQSGGGKSTLLAALGGMLPRFARIRAERWELFGASVAGSNGCPAIDLSGAGLSHALRSAKGGRFFPISQDARSSLIPYRTVYWHLERAYRQGLRGSNAWNAFGRLSRRYLAERREDYAGRLQNLGFTHAVSTLSKYPRQLATGQCQRVQFAMAMLLGIDLLLADEPFASVDKDSKRLLVEHLNDLLGRGAAIVLVTHDLELLASVSGKSQLAVVCNGAFAEIGPRDALLGELSPKHPHTQLLLDLASCSSYAGLRTRPIAQDVACVFASGCNRASREVCVERWPARQDADGHHHRIVCLLPDAQLKSSQLSVRPSADSTVTGAMPPRRVLLQARGLTKLFDGKEVLKNQDLTIFSGTRVAILGPSGVGKTTLARILMGLEPYHVGQLLRFPESARDLSGNRLSPASKRLLWRRLQMVHQDSDLAFDPGEVVGEGLVEAYRSYFRRVRRETAWQYAQALFECLHLDGQLLRAPPFRLSGGERKRASIARSLAMFGYMPDDVRPHEGPEVAAGRVLILDEPTVGVDAFRQGVLAQTLLDAQRRLQLTYLVLSHDEGFVRRFCTLPVVRLDVHEFTRKG